MNVPTAYPLPYIEYLAEYHGSRDYFECHEIMEEYWKEQPNTRYSDCWLVFIRIAVACYHARRGNWPGALKMLRKSVEEVNTTLMDELGIDGSALAKQLIARYDEWKRTETSRVYSDIDLPIADAALKAVCVRYCEERGWEWKRCGHETEEELIHRHTRRDRSDVIEARRLSAERKKN